mmetsp:Transcript_87948/g.282310  ORF Transcript_87948/g.282310 Transcript_87948/m.282310 type:complete len:105 (+) Transcript_87948:598-912(+)
MTFMVTPSAVVEGQLVMLCLNTDLQDMCLLTYDATCVRNPPMCRADAIFNLLSVSLHALERQLHSAECSQPCLVAGLPDMFIGIEPQLLRFGGGQESRRDSMSS